MFWSNKILCNFYKYKRKIYFYALQQQRSATTNCKEEKRALDILFFGTDSFSLPSLKILHQNRFSEHISELSVVTSFKSPPNCVRRYAEQQGLALYRWPVSTDMYYKFDLGVVVSFGHLIPETLINACRFGMINVHASLLPRWRGAAPIIYAIMNGDISTGVSIMKIEPKRFDVGDILAHREIPIANNSMMPDLHAILAKEGAELLMDVIKGYPKSFQDAKHQNNEEASYAPKITAAITDVPWTEITARQLFDRFRALYGFKNLKAKFQDKNVQLIDVNVAADVSKYSIEATSTPGGFIYDRNKNCLIVRCADDSYLEVHKLRVEGKKVMSAKDFHNGFCRKLNILFSFK